MNELWIMGARFLMSEEEVPREHRGKTRMNSVGTELEVSV